MSATTFPTYDTVDLFAGPGGWSVAAQRLGLREIGIEFDQAARLTRKAAGFATIRDDVRNWGPANFPNARGLIASPPCQTFSAAGKGAGRKALDVVLEAVREMTLAHMQERPFVHPEWSDERTSLVLEPLRWALEAIRLGQPYEWLAFEQVPAVLPVWEAMAESLRMLGYSVATGNLQAEQYGVPQTRKRAVLIASRTKPVSLPTPTHSKYHIRDKARLDPGVLPWVSMAQALGWDSPAEVRVSVSDAGYRKAPNRQAEEPSATVTGKHRSAVVMRSNYGSGGDPAARGIRTDVEPAPTMTSKADRNLWLRQSAQQNATVRREDEPAPTITAAHDSGERQWVHERPATTVVGSFSPETIAAPGYRVSKSDGSRQNAPGSVRVTPAEAAALQSFPPGHPFQGSKTKVFRQIGDAIPPLLAEAVLRQVIA